MKHLLRDLREELKSLEDIEIQKSSQRYFKSQEQVKSYGIKIPKIREIEKKFFKKAEKIVKQEVFSLCEELWQSGYLEESFIACDWSYQICSKYEAGDLGVFYGWLEKYVDNWASCDTLCNHTIGKYLEMYPEQIGELKKWAIHENRWVKRGAAVSLIIPARKGMFLPEIFEIAEILLLDSDDLVQKGYGWMLKAASESHPKEVYDYMISKKAIMPRTAFRYGLEKMPAEWRKEAMKK